MRQLAKKLLSAGGYYRFLRRLKSTGSPVHLILMYHDISSDLESGSVESIIRDRPSRLQFEAQLMAIKSAARVLTVEDATDEIIKLNGLQEDTVSITFDDGYQSVYEQAYPLLRKHSLPATVYLTTDWIDGKMELWWEELADIFAACEIDEARKRKMSALFDIAPESLEVTSSDSNFDRIHLHELVAGVLRGLEDEEVASKISDLANITGFNQRDREPSQHLTWENIREMAASHVTFGSHTCSHLNIRHAGMETLEFEISESKRKIEEEVGHVVEGFAYPYGQDVTAYERMAPMLKKNGIVYACTASPGINRVGSNLYTLARETLPSTTSLALLERDLCLDFVGDK